MTRLRTRLSLSPGRRSKSISCLHQRLLPPSNAFSHTHISILSNQSSIRKRIRSEGSKVRTKIQKAVKRAKEHAEQGFLVSGTGHKRPEFWDYTRNEQSATASATVPELLDYLTEVFKQHYPGSPVPDDIDRLTQAMNNDHPVTRTTQRVGSYEVLRFDFEARRGDQIPVLISSYNKETFKFRVLAIASSNRLTGRLFQGRRGVGGKNDGQLVCMAMKKFGYSSLITRGKEAGFLHFQKLSEIEAEAETV